jgi:uncharacterized protein (TIGR03435 family)
MARRFFDARSMVRITLLFVGVSGALTLAQAPSTDAAAPVSYVASVKRSSGDGPGGRIMMQPGRIVISGMPVRTLIRQAYGQLQDFQIVGGPNWMNSDRFDIEAKLEDTAPSAEANRAMQQQLLVDRFKLKFHRETRELPVFALVLMRSDGKLGSGLKPSAPDCKEQMLAGARGRGGPPPGARGGQPPSPTAVPFDGPVPCGTRGGGPGRLRAGGMTMATFATMLSGPTQRVVVDKTGLTELYDLDLTYTPSPDQMPTGAPPPGVELPPVDPNGPSLFTALQEQLGLKLESQRGPVDVLVIESLEPPTEN